jgi:hypothetical protein
MSFVTPTFSLAKCSKKTQVLVYFKNSKFLPMHIWICFIKLHFNNNQYHMQKNNFFYSCYKNGLQFRPRPVGIYSVVADSVRKIWPVPFWDLLPAPPPPLPRCQHGVADWRSIGLRSVAWRGGQSIAERSVMAGGLGKMLACAASQGGPGWQSVCCYSYLSLFSLLPFPWPVKL